MWPCPREAPHVVRGRRVWRGKSGSVRWGWVEGRAVSRVSFVRVHAVSSPGWTSRREGASPGPPPHAHGRQLISPGPILTRRPRRPVGRHQPLRSPREHSGRQGYWELLCVVGPFTPLNSFSREKALNVDGVQFIDFFLV